MHTYRMLQPLHMYCTLLLYSGKHWRDKTLVNSAIYAIYLKEKSLAIGLMIAYRYLRLHKFVGENFGDLPNIHQIHQCFMAPMFSPYIQ